MKKLKVCVVTGTRAEFGIWRPVLAAIAASKFLELKLVVTGTHLLKEFGGTVREIETEGLEIAARVPMYRQTSAAGRKKKEGGEAAEALARGIGGLAAAYRNVGAEVVMVLGDRLEMLAAASAALAERIPIAHVHGGETAPGIWDEQIRHAITKMAHVHFCATQVAGKRIRQMGEQRGRVHVVGAPSLDHFRKAWLSGGTKQALMESSKIRPMLLLHPSGGTNSVEYQRTMMVLSALEKFFPNYRMLTVGPNNDPGHQGILRAYRERRQQVWLKMSLPQFTFQQDLAEDGLLVGNSSAGIIEAASLPVAVINIGDRQAGRERNANVIDVPWQVSAIRRAIEKATTDRRFLKQVAQRINIYGDGHASGRIVEVLEKIAEEGIKLEKRFEG